MTQPRPRAIPLVDLVPRYAAIVSALRRRYGEKAAAYLGPAGPDALALLEAQLSDRLEEWQWIVRGRALGVLTYVYYWAINENFHPGPTPLEVSDNLHAVGVSAQHAFLQAAAAHVGLNTGFAPVDVRVVWFEMLRQPLRAALVEDARRYAAGQGKPKYGSPWVFLRDRWRFYVPSSRRAAAAIVDHLEMWLLEAVHVQPRSRAIQRQVV